MPLVLASQAMGTRFELVLPGRDEVRERAAGEAALEAVAECEQRLSLFRPGSLLSLVNREASARPVALDPDTFALLELCARCWRESDGAFDAAQGARMAQLGFRGQAPAAGPVAGFEAVALDPRTCRVRFTAPGVQLDLGGVAKGHALDAAVEVLREAGVEQALLHGGTSTVVALGAPPGLAGWRVALERGGGAPVVELRDAALAVSAQHGRRNERGEGHVLDPRSGCPASDDRVAAVIAPRGALADAWSTALLVRADLPRTSDLAGMVGAGPEGARRWRPCGAAGPFLTLEG
jgi:thiamine biosynthesis lipoprotein